MSAIWGINNGYNIDNKKISNKVNFKYGEKFVGKVISKNENNEVLVKSIDGFQFKAEVDGKINLENGQVLKFEVEDIKDGKLKIKVVEEKLNYQWEVAKDNFQRLAEKEGLLKENGNLLREMIKRDIPLTKDNIIRYKSVIEFAENLSINLNESEEFIKKYISSKDIDISSLEGQKIDKTFKEFIGSFRTMTREDILLFLENDIDLTKENIDSFNKLFKREEGVIKLFKELGEKLDLNESSEFLNKDIKKENNIDYMYEKDIDNNLIKDSKVDKSRSFKSSENINNGLDEMHKDNSETSGVDILKNIANKSEISRVLICGVKELFLSSNIDENNISDKINEVILKFNDDEFIDILKGSISTDKSINQFTKKDLEEAFSKVFKIHIELSENDFNNIKKVISEKADLSKFINEKNKNIFVEESSKNLIKSKDISFTNELKGKELIKLDLKIDFMKEIVEKTLKSLDSSVSDKVMQIIKENINDFKLYNSLCKEYYYLDIPITREDRNYPCKLIIKDDRKGGKKIDKTNVKLVVSVKTVNIGIIDSFLAINNKNLNVKLKCDKEYIELINSFKDQLINSLKSIGFFVSIDVLKKEEDLSLSNCREFFSYENNRTLDISV